MNAQNTETSRDDVLYAFSVEPIHSADVLKSYLREYPQFAIELVELSRELDRDDRIENRPLTGEDHSLIESAWQKHANSVFAAPTDPFQLLSIDSLRALAQKLDVPRQVISAFRDRKVLLSSVPRRFLSKMADAMEINADGLIAALKATVAPAAQPILKADAKPPSTEPVSFEKILMDAGVSSEKRATLLADD